MGPDPAALTGPRHPASFRDPSGFVFLQGDGLFRHVSASYQQEYDLLLSSGLYEDLVRARLLLPHQELEPDLRARGSDAYRILRPEPVPFISYPYEWSFSQLQDAALLTLDIHWRALDRGMVLKDASAYNVQFVDGRPIHIDTLSFGIYTDGSPWVAYRQFCQHFVAPLMLMSRVDVRLARLLRTYPDGIPVDLASRLLPRRSWFHWGPLLHLHLHARSLARHADTRLNEAPASPRVSLRAQRGLLESLRSIVRLLAWRPAGTEWGDYSGAGSYSAESHAAKVMLVREYIGELDPAPNAVWDLGANTGVFSRIAAECGARVVAFDVDAAAVEKNYREQRSRGGGPVLPLLLDLMSPSPGLGWANAERDAWTERGRPDLLLALALVHHLAIGNNVPLEMIAELFGSLAPALIVEFVPKSDPQVLRLLGSRADIFPNYDEGGCESAFGRHFRIRRTQQLPGSARRLYLMERP
jgi:ribosomal protein L11 methylase PrmA